MGSIDFLKSMPWFDARVVHGLDEAPLAVGAPWRPSPWPSGTPSRRRRDWSGWPTRSTAPAPSWDRRPRPSWPARRSARRTGSSRCGSAARSGAGGPPRTWCPTRTCGPWRPCEREGRGGERRPRHKGDCADLFHFRSLFSFLKELAPDKPRLKGNVRIGGRRCSSGTDVVEGVNDGMGAGGRPRPPSGGSRTQSAVGQARRARGVELFRHVRDEQQPAGAAVPGRRRWRRSCAPRASDPWSCRSSRGDEAGEIADRGVGEQQLLRQHAARREDRDRLSPGVRQRASAGGTSG